MSRRGWCAGGRAGCPIHTPTVRVQQPGTAEGKMFRKIYTLVLRSCPLCISTLEKNRNKMKRNAGWVFECVSCTQQSAIQTEPKTPDLLAHGNSGRTLEWEQRIQLLLSPPAGLRLAPPPNSNSLASLSLNLSHLSLP